jgi:GT2 family glycosyltransferase
MIELAAIVNSFNRFDLLKEALPSLLRALRGCPWESSVVIFDAGSTDGSREWLEATASTDKSISLLQPSVTDDASFSGGINAACAFALKQNPALKWLLFFETDNWLAGATPLNAAAFLLEQEPRLGAVGFTVRKHDRRPAGYGCPFPRPRVLPRDARDVRNPAQTTPG